MKRQRVRHALALFSFLLFPITIYYFSPALVIQGAFAGIATGSLVVFGSQFLASLIFGRAFCGWLCPAGGLQEALFSVNPAKAGQRRWIRYLTWVPWMAVIIFAVWSAGGLKAVDFFYETTGSSLWPNPLPISQKKKLAISFFFIVQVCLHIICTLLIYVQRIFSLRKVIPGCRTNYNLAKMAGRYPICTSIR